METHDIGRRLLGGALAVFMLAMIQPSTAFQVQTVNTAGFPDCLQGAAKICDLGCGDNTTLCRCNLHSSIKFKPIELGTPAVLAESAQAEEATFTADTPNAWRVIVGSVLDGHLDHDEFASIQSAVAEEPRYTPEERVFVLLVVEDWFAMPGN